MASRTRQRLPNESESDLEGGDGGIRALTNRGALGHSEPARESVGWQVRDKKFLRASEFFRDQLGGFVSRAHRAFHRGRPTGTRPVAGEPAILPRANVGWTHLLGARGRRVRRARS